jgi:hypothetical protein
VKKRLLPILVFIALVLISKPDRLRELGEIWPTLTATEKVLAILAFILLVALVFAASWVISLGWAAMRRGVSRLARRR